MLHSLILSAFPSGRPRSVIVSIFHGLVGYHHVPISWLKYALQVARNHTFYILSLSVNQVLPKVFDVQRKYRFLAHRKI